MRIVDCPCKISDIWICHVFSCGQLLFILAVLRRNWITVQRRHDTEYKLLEVDTFLFMQIMHWIIACFGVIGDKSNLPFASCSLSIWMVSHKRSLMAWVVVIPKEWWSLFWYDNDSWHEGPLRVTPLKIFILFHALFYLILQHPQAHSSMMTSRSSASSMKSPPTRGYHHHASSSQHHHHHPAGPVSPPRLPQQQQAVHPQRPGESRQGWASPNRELEVGKKYL